jgi:hypothetical protein
MVPRGEEGLGPERMLARLGGDDGAAHLRRRQVVREVGAEEGPGAHPDVDVQVVEVQSVQGLIDRPQGADLIDRSLGRSRGERQADLFPAATGARRTVAAFSVAFFAHGAPLS